MSISRRSPPTAAVYQRSVPHTSPPLSDGSACSASLVFSSSHPY